MELALEVLILVLDLGLGVAALVLIPTLSRSVFSGLPRYMLVLAVSLFAHTLAGMLLSGDCGFFIYGLSAMIASLSYLFLVYGVFAVLKNISANGRGERLK